MVTADYDNDGLLDVLVLRGAWMGAAGQFPMSLLRNRGGLRFDDVTKAAGLLRLRPSQTATWLDFDGDGFLDLFVGNESGGPAINPCELYRNNRDGTFSEIAKASGVDLVAFVKGVVSGDYDNDGDPDIFVSVAQGANLLFRNDGPGPRGSTGWRFTNVAAQAGVELPKNSFPAMFFDYDNDGWLDLFVAPYWGSAEDVAADYLGLETSVERGKLYRNKGDGTFADVTREAGLHTVMQAMGLNYGDLDNDGWLDFYAGTGNPDFHTLVPNRMFRNDGGTRFQDVTTAGNFGHLQKGHGIAWGDVDNDGDLDIFEQMGGAYQADRAYSALYENPRAPAARQGRLGEPRARRHDRQSRGHRGAGHGPARDAGRAAPHPPRRVERRQLRRVDAARVRRPRRRHPDRRRRCRLAAGGQGCRGRADVRRPRAGAALPAEAGRARPDAPDAAGDAFVPIRRAARAPVVTARGRPAVTAAARMPSIA